MKAALVFFICLLSGCTLAVKVDDARVTREEIVKAFAERDEALKKLAKSSSEANSAITILIDQIGQLKKPK